MRAYGCDCCGSFAEKSPGKGSPLPPGWISITWSLRQAEPYGAQASKVHLCGACRFADPRKPTDCPHARSSAE